MNKEYELLEYLSKFFDENVCIRSTDNSIICCGTCTAIEPMLSDNNGICINVTDENNNVHTFYICTYDYKRQAWFDGNLKKDMTITFI